MNDLNSRNNFDHRSADNPNVSLESFDLITACFSPTPLSLARYLANIIDNNKSKSNVIVFYIDASNTFPLYQFEKLIPKNGKGDNIYESIRIQIVLNLNELSIALRKILQFVSREKVMRHLNKVNNQRGLKILIVLLGIEIMFKNSRMSFPEERHHTILRDLFLRLRVEANHSNNNSGLTLRTVIIVPFQAYQKCQPSKVFCSPNVKRQRMMTQMHNENSVADYIIKFYADALISLP